MEKFTKKLLNGFLLSGIAFFGLVALTFLVVQIWPVIWDEWNEYKKGEDLQSAKITNIRLYKNDFFNQADIDTLENRSLKKWYKEREKNDMLSPNGAGDYYLEKANEEYKLQIVNLKDSIIYAEIDKSFNPFTTKAPSSTFIGSGQFTMPFPRDIINDKMQLILKNKDSVFSRFKPFVLKESLNIGAGFGARKNKEIRMVSTDGKMLVYIEFELQ
ncbi:hypothetical protein [Pedobacter punctiformis]|uniref:Uncharacterized protein n=1 Tax=Pedobacter punctiformis TaxID=3004097 RepID=A0ABT4LGC2_9SPHI|nr:hypothetical protein [Pedobacter sp. HCMS5-2]MCZ4245849.1 hypothetical protein [Pedobacter sp. HCMS5-2]